MQKDKNFTKKSASNHTLFKSPCYQPILFLSQPKVLIVEDNQLIQYFMKTYFTKLGFQVDIAEDGLKAMDMFKSGYDLILLDIHMPNMNGIEVAKSIRLYEKTHLGNKNILISISTFDDLLIEKFKDVGFDDNYKKPALYDDLNGIIHKWIPHLIASKSQQFPPPFKEAKTKGFL